MRGKEKMNTFEILLEQMGLFVIYLLAGVILIKTKVLSSEMLEAISRFVVKMALPILVFVNITDGVEKETLTHSVLILFITAGFYFYAFLRIWHDEIISFERRQSRNLSGNVDVWKCGIYGNPDYYKHFSEKWHFIYFSIYDNRPVYALDFGSKIYNSARRRKI